MRFIKCLLDNGHMAPVFLQEPGLSDKEMPQDKVPSGVAGLKLKIVVSGGSLNIYSMSN